MSDTPQHDSAMDRALGALYGLAIGDALGMPTQELDRASAMRILGTPPDFRNGPPENPISRGLKAGTVTDDTMQSVLIARLLINGNGVIEPRRLAEALMEWEREMIQRGSTDLLGPSTKRALAALAEGADPTVTGRTGTTNGAAMRITPVGIATKLEPLDRLIAAVVAADHVTHDADVAHAGAAAVATVVSAGVGGVSLDEALPMAIRSAAVFGFAAVFEKALTVKSVDAIIDEIGTGVETVQSVPAAFAVARLSRGDAWQACAMGAALGGDADTIAALAGAMVGACTGLSGLPPRAVRRVRQVNGLDFEPLAQGLLELRRR